MKWVHFAQTAAAVAFCRHNLLILFRMTRNGCDLTHFVQVSTVWTRRLGFHRRTEFSMPQDLIQLARFGVAFGEKVVLAPLTLALPARGAVVLMGPAGAGKSTLLRSMAGANHAQPSLRTVGAALIDGIPMGAGGAALGLALMGQNARLVVSSVQENLLSGAADRLAIPPGQQHTWAEALLRRLELHDLVPRLREAVVTLPLGVQRLVAIARTVASDPRALLVDEPTASLDDDDAERVLTLLGLVARQRLVLMVTHNQRHARRLGGRIILLAGGRVMEEGAVDDFFAHPTTVAGRGFVRTGSCSVASPTTPPEHLDERAEPPPRLPQDLLKASRAVGPRGFHWVLPGQLAGMPRPGLLDELDEQLDLLKDLGVDVLVTLEEQMTVAKDVLDAHHTESIHFPIVDMGAPRLDDCLRHCARVDHALQHGRVVAYHCRAGLGRTGTMLAALLVYRGERPVTAIERIRRIQPRFIQSAEQVDFLGELRRYIDADVGPLSTLMQGGAT